MSNATVQIPNDVLQPIIEAKVAAAIIEALGGRQQLIETAVAQVLAQKVDPSSGNPDRYNSSNSPTWLTWVLQDLVKKAAKGAIEQFVTEHQELIHKHLVTELTKKNSPLTKQIIASLVGATFNPDTLRYRLTVSVDK